MMRIAVAYMFEGEAAERLNELRRQYDPKSATNVDAHVTVAAPIEWPEDMEAAANRLRSLLADEPPFTLTVNGVGTFLPDSPTCFAAVSPRERLTQIHDRIVEVLGSKERWPFKPHSTLTEYLSPDRTREVVVELSATRLHFECPVDHLSLLKQVKGGRWQPFFDLPLLGANGH
jgi:2'-5' RNA ligase